MIADSDMFGNIIFKEWFESKSMAFDKISPLDQRIMLLISMGL
jgi:serine/threonine-protein kinase HipA